jgi:hypothetical protein
MILTEDGLIAKRGETIWAIGTDGKNSVPVKCITHSRNPDYMHFEGMRLYKERKNCQEACDKRNNRIK